MSYYHFLYCIIHDDGFVVKSKTIDIPEDYNITCKCEASNHCDFIYNGMLNSDGDNIKEIVPILRYYDKYGGGFEFSYYKSYFAKNSKIYKWLDN